MKSMKFQALFLAFAWITSEGSAALYCNYCYSNKSWEECESKSEQHYCKDNIPYVCYTSHIVEKKNGKEIHSYQKGCGGKDICTGEECVNHWCNVHCCNTDACNKAMFFNANYMTCITLTLLTAAHLL
ncbi:hypothetical protein OS493_036263 [Desmophyllum pertusum]|uniref:Uncharacterized protein n=1 Tax=Desmophyllum pertusum TaxID=174260 RepID=A0A9X0D0F9_9CNID|nr:hypothetical protein OS493_036263 [Desmophyllum pertusum]